ncbi:hypothetical protein [Streptococcus halichoeri]|uniref:hypothetical protein n=1 Tax=Streptococcus halichoeri TaxID=254785 RepID=UPI00135BF360|nr:hypothetical protein [Streptococcus halichoeri]
MSKKFLQSLTILGLLSTALGVAQPVGAVVGNSEYNENYNLRKIEIDKLENHGLKIPQWSLKRMTDGLLALIEKVNYILSKYEFQDNVYAAATSKLSYSVSPYDMYLSRLTPVTTDDLNGYTIEEKQVANLTITQYNFIQKQIKEALEKFLVDVYSIQAHNPMLFPAPFYLPNVSDNIQSTINYSYYDLLYDRLYDYTEQPPEVKKKLDAYRSVLRDILILKKEIDLLLVNKERRNDALDELNLTYNMIFNTAKRQSQVTPDFKVKENFSFLLLSEDIPNIKIANEKLNALKEILFDYFKATSNEKEIEKYKLTASNLEDKNSIEQQGEISKERRAEEYNKYLEQLKSSQLKINSNDKKRTGEDYSFDFDEEDDSQVEKSEKIKKNTEENQESKNTVTEPSQSVSSPTTPQEPTQTITSSSVQTNSEQSSNTNASDSSSSEVSAVSSSISQGVSSSASSSSETVAMPSQAPQQVTTEEPKEFKITEESAQPSKTAEQVKDTDEMREVTVELPQPGQAKAAEPVSSPLDAYTKSQINFWIEDFNTSLNKINYSGIYSEYLESLITRGKQLRNKLDKALGENKSSDDIKRDLDQLEMISNTITSVGNARNS